MFIKHLAYEAARIVQVFFKFAMFGRFGRSLQLVFIVLFTFQQLYKAFKKL